MKIIGSVLFVLPTKILSSNYNVAHQSNRHHSYLFHNKWNISSTNYTKEKMNFIQIEMVKYFVNFVYNLNYIFLTKTIGATMNRNLNIYHTFLFKAEKCEYLEKSDPPALKKAKNR
jgi:hypothetical protein